MTSPGGDQLITVFGGSGFVGRHTVRALAQDGWRIRAACRRPDLAGHLQPMGRVGQIHPVQANLRYPDSVARAVEGASAVVNCVGILARAGPQTFTAIHDEGARQIALAARAAGAHRLVHVSAIGADPNSSSDYARTKGVGERDVLDEFPPAVIVRPSVVFGPEDDLFNRFAALAGVSPLLPLIGGGSTRFQPVFVGDLAAAIAAACAGQARPGTIYEIGGPEVLTFRELLDKTLQWIGRSRGYLPMPFWMAKLLALVTWPLPNSLRPLTYDQVRLLGWDNVVSDLAINEGRTLAALGVPDPHAMGSVVPTYLERFRPRGQFSHYRG